MVGMMTATAAPLIMLFTEMSENRGDRGASTKAMVLGLGCCWALMTVLFVVGIMNLAWVAVLTVFVLSEKLGRIGVLGVRAGSVIMIGYGVLILAI